MPLKEEERLFIETIRDINSRTNKNDKDDANSSTKIDSI